VLRQSRNEALVDAVRRPSANAQLYFVADAAPGIARKPVKRGFTYTTASGKAVRDAGTLARIRALVIPPAWTDVWICADAQGHIQATGRDARGRKQYRYHPDFIQQRDAAKYDHLIAFGTALPKVRRTISRHMNEKGLTRRKVLATVAHLLDTTLIRVGNPEYARENKSYGLTTLQDRHAAISGCHLRFKFRGKTGKEWNLQITDRRIARIVRSCQELPGQHLFQYKDQTGKARAITSSDVNDYIRSIAGPDVSAKDFRTWAGTVQVAGILKNRTAGSETAIKRTIREAIACVAAQLGNTPAICRKCDVHPAVLSAFAEGALARATRKTKRITTLSANEALTLKLLTTRSRRAPQKR